MGPLEWASSGHLTNCSFTHFHVCLDFQPWIFCFLPSFKWAKNIFIEAEKWMILFGLEAPTLYISHLMRLSSTSWSCDESISWQLTVCTRSTSAETRVGCGPPVSPADCNHLIVVMTRESHQAPVEIPKPPDSPSCKCTSLQYTIWNFMKMQRE